MSKAKREKSMRATSACQPWFKEWLKKAMQTEEFQRKHFDKFGYAALVEACRKMGVPVLIPEVRERNTKKKKE